MIIAIIVALSENRAIGVDNALPWQQSADLKRFRKLTMGHHLILGRRTYEALPRPLDGRKIIVLSRQWDFRPEGCLVAHSLEEAIAIAEAAGEDELFIGGGGQVYAQALEVVERMYVTLVHTHVEADTFFPPIDEQVWVETWSEDHEPGEFDPYPYTFKVLERRTAPA